MHNRSSGDRLQSLANTSSNSLMSPGYLLAAEALVSASSTPHSTQSSHVPALDADLDSLAQSHRRKMQRRQANRKSAQLSRARKKAYLEELKEENSKLQHMADILNSQAEFIFSFVVGGSITHIPERIENMIKSAADDPDEEITNISQILTQESVVTLMDSLKEICEKDKGQAVSFVKEVFYHDATGFPVAGFMRCSRLTRRKRVHSKTQGDDDSDDDSDSDDKGGKSKAQKKSINHTSRLHSSIGSGIDESGYYGSPDEEEYVCVIRPASSSSPFLNNLHLLSAASMVAHDSVTTHNPVVSGPDCFDARNRKRSGTPSDGSNSSGLPHSSLTTDQTKDSTNSSAGTNSGSNSSEDRSNHSEENNGSEDNDCQSRNSGSDHDNLIQ